MSVLLRVWGEGAEQWTGRFDFEGYLQECCGVAYGDFGSYGDAVYRCDLQSGGVGQSSIQDVPDEA